MEIPIPDIAVLVERLMEVVGGGSLQERADMCGIIHVLSVFSVSSPGCGGCFPSGSQGDFNSSRHYVQTRFPGKKREISPSLPFH